MKKIYPKKWLELHPYKQTNSVDQYYVGIANEIHKRLYSSTIADAFEEEENIRYTSLCLAAWFEDVISQTGIWQAFTAECRKRYGAYLPFYPIKGDYFPDEINLEDIRFLLWHHIQYLCRGISAINPENPGIEQTAQEIYGLLAEEYETAPENERMQEFLYHSAMGEEDFFRYREILDWFHYQCYFNIENIAQLINDGFENTIPVIDNKEEIDLYDDAITKKCKIGIRIASEEEPKFEFYTSRLGIRYNDIINFYKTKIQKNKKFKLKMLHFFINTGIKDTAYYWNELSKCLNIYCELKAICPDLDSLNIGGGFPIKNSLDFSYDYEYLTEEIIAQIKNICTRNGIDEPHIFTEFGSFTVGESGATLYSIVNQKQQNDRENWYMIDSSFITTLPDTWGINQRYIMLAINNWDKEYQRVLLGGLTCDSEDFYNSESHINAIFLPKLEPGNPQYIGFFHTGAYQESIGGFGGIQHCLIPAPKHVIIDRDKDDNEYYTRLFAKEQSYRSMLRILGY